MFADQVHGEPGAQCSEDSRGDNLPSLQDLCSARTLGPTRVICCSNRSTRTRTSRHRNSFVPSAATLTVFKLFLLFILYRDNKSDCDKIILILKVWLMPPEKIYYLVFPLKFTAVTAETSSGYVSASFLWFCCLKLEVSSSKSKILLCGQTVVLGTH